MHTFLEGSYESLKDAIRSVDTLVMRGHSKDDIILVSSTDKKDELNKESVLTLSTVDEIDVNSDLLEEVKQELHQHDIVVLVKEDADEGKELSNEMNTLNADVANDRSESGPRTASDDSENNSGVDLPGNVSTRDVNNGIDRNSTDV